MRIIFFLLLPVIFLGCAIKPEYAIQTSTGLEVGLNKETNKEFLLVDKYNRVIGKSESYKKELIFSLPSYTSPNTCYAILDADGESLFSANTGVMITSVYNYNHKLEKLNLLKDQYDNYVRKQINYSNALSNAESNLNSHKLFNGRTCDLPPQRAIPPFPKSICGSYQQCMDLAHDSCMKNLVDAESCGAALSKTNVHSSITSMSCGALLASLNGESYGIGSGLQDALTGYLDEHTKIMIDTGEYGKAIGTGIFRIVYTYLRTENCKDNFTRAAYAPIERWEREKAYIEGEPYRAQEICNTLIRNYKTSLAEFNQNRSYVTDLKEEIYVLSQSVEKAKDATSNPQICTFK